MVTLGVRSGSAPAGTRGEFRAPHPPTVGLLAQLAVLGLVATGVGLGPAGWLAGGVYAVASWVLLSRALGTAALPAGTLPVAGGWGAAAGWGPANTVTLARATLVGGVAALVADSFWRPAGASGSVGVLVALATVAMLLDAVDGHVARRTGTTSGLGARFDMETDSVLVLVLSVFVAGLLGWWVLAAGAFRYGFAAAAWALPWLRAPVPPQRSAKLVAAVQGAVLVVASAGVLPRGLAAAAVGLVLVLLGWSFGRHISRLRQARQARQARQVTRQEVTA